MKRGYSRYSYYRRPPLSHNWAKIDSDITNRMHMFKSYLSSLPKNRSDYVTELEIPEITLKPYECTDLDDSCSLRSDSFLTESLGQYDKSTLSTNSSIPLSRAMTDSEIDYEFYKRYKNCNYTDTWEHLRDAVHAFPPDYVASLDRHMSLDSDVDEELLNSEMHGAAELAESRRRHNEEWRRRLERRFEEEVYVYSPDDPSLFELQEAMRNLDMKNLEADLASIQTYPSRLRRRLALNRLRRTYNLY